MVGKVLGAPRLAQRAGALAQAWVVGDFPSSMDPGTSWSRMGGACRSPGGLPALMFCDLQNLHPSVSGVQLQL